MLTPKPHFNISPTPASGTSNSPSVGANNSKSFGSAAISSGQTVGTGILQPAMQHKFIVRVEGTPQEFSMQSVAFAMNMAKNEILMIIEQSLTATIREHVVIQDIIDNPNRLITLDIMNPNTGQINDTIKFLDCVIEDHSVDFNCANIGAVAHILIWSYSQIDLGAGSAASAYASAMSIVGRP